MNIRVFMYSIVHNAKQRVSTLFKKNINKSKLKEWALEKLTFLWESIVTRIESVGTEVELT
ncbi:hypothetical protein GCM10011389_34320 [Pontibacillus salipaludis]|uniref:Transposase n=1 Tax=Pontibacillus salipaludis TaxID=1697394 RepID=A0ABQ1QET5_9BACI|nr:hypothetical protein GCM10011389_34320 [Pontibacillus salipaludis]